jgi:hypothetical protein
MPTLLRSALVTAGLLLNTACPVSTHRPNPDHCWNAEGDATCWTQFGAALPFCTYDVAPCGVEVPRGCVAERPLLDECYSPCGGGQSILEDSNCAGMADDSGTGNLESESTEADSTDRDSTGSESDSSESDFSDSMGDDCDGACESPMLCHDGTCVECTPELPGPCIAAQAWCDPDQGFSCVACTNHFQCPGGAGCHLEFGTCLPHDRVYNVPMDWTLDEALTMLGDQDGTVRIDDDSSSYSRESTFYLAEDQVVAVVPPDGVRPVIERLDSGSSPDYAFQVAAGHLYLWGIDFSGEAGVRISQTGKLHAERAAFDTTRAAIFLSGGEADLRSCMLISDNDSISPTLGVVNSGIAAIAFSTILARAGDNALFCNSGSAISVRNSILGSFDSSNGIAISNCEAFILSSAVEHANDGFVVSAPEVVIGDLYPNDFVDPDTGNLHLAPGPAPKFESLAHWSVGDPIDDFDGDLRATQGATWPGADHPQ